MNPLVTGSLLALSLAALPRALPAQGAFVEAEARALPLTSAASGFDNVRGSWLNFETAPIQPLFVDGPGRRVIALNQPGLRLAVLDLDTLELLQEIPTGPGLVAAVPRPGTDEVWVTDAVTHSLGVVDLSAGALVRTIRLRGSEPHGLVFHPSGDRVYVACSASHSVEVVRTADYRSVNSIDVPALQPRAITFQDGKVWVAPLLSGNNSTAAGPLPLPNTIEFIVDLGVIPGVNELPDRDLLGIVPMPDPKDDFLDPALTVREVGTNLFNAHARPGTTEVWIPNTEALNVGIRGAANAVDGQVVRNRVTIVDVSSGDVVHVDLDATALDERNCAQPFCLTFDETGDTAYVAGYGSDVIARLDAASPTSGWTGYYEVPGRDNPLAGTPDHAGPRGLALVPERDELLVFNKGDNSVSALDLERASPFGGAAGTPHSLGYDPTTDSIRLGRLHAIDAGLSKSGTTSCASCHIDGSLDGVVWDLSTYLDPEGTSPISLVFPVDVKGPMVTQRLRGLPESGPYHWRGERKSLFAFNAVFTDLMDRSEPLPPADFAALQEYLFSLVYLSNPRQTKRRDYEGAAELGRVLHTATDLVVPAFPGASKCAVCHALPLGSNGEVFRNNPSTTTLSTVVPQMRGLQDKLGELHDVGSVVGALRTEQGIGAMHSGGRGTIYTYHASQGLFVMTEAELQQMVAFLQEFDTGLAPSTAYQYTVTRQNSKRFLGDEDDGLPYLRSQLESGHCDLAVYARYIGGPAPEQLGRATTSGTGPGSAAPGGEDVGPSAAQANTAVSLTGGPHSGGVTELVGGGAVHRVNLAYDHASGKLRLPYGDAVIAIEDLLALVTKHEGTATFLGLPLGMGWRSGIDRDFDGLLDGEELLRGTDPEQRDSDGDGFDDGHEVAHGMSPTAPNAASRDETAPMLLASTVVYSTVNTVKVEFTTSEVCRAKLSLGGVTAEGPALGVLDVNHSLILAPLPAGLDTDATLELTDGAGNVTSTTVPIVTLERVVPLVARVAAIALDDYDAGADEATITVGVSDQLGGALADPSAVQAFAYYEDDATPLTIVTTGTSEPVVGATATFVLSLPAPGSPDGRKLHFGVTQVDNELSYVLAEDVTRFETFALIP